MATRQPKSSFMEHIQSVFTKYSERQRIMSDQDAVLSGQEQESGSRRDYERRAKATIAELKRQGITSTPDIKRALNQRGLNTQRADRLEYIDDSPTLSDELGFRPVAESLADLLISTRTGTPFVLGIDGKWGSGKTSLCKQIEAIFKERIGTGIEEGIVTFWLDTWRHDTSKQFAIEFVRTLGTALKTRPIDDQDRFDRELSLLEKRAGSNLWLDTATEEAIRELILSAFSAPEAAAPRAVVFMDDLDRCSARQMNAFLRFLRPLLLTHNIAIVLPCDKEQVLRTLSVMLVPQNEQMNDEHESSRGMEATASEQSSGAAGQYLRESMYLERIVRLWVTMPRPTQKAISSYLLDLMGSGSRFSDAISRNYIRLAASVVDGNPRRLKVMINSYNLYYDLLSTRISRINAELQDLDLPVGGTVLKVFFLRHFWPERFERFSHIATQFLTTQEAALSEEQGKVLAEEATLLRRWMLDSAFRRLLTLEPLLTDRHVDRQEGTFAFPLGEIFATAALCPPSLSKSMPYSSIIGRYLNPDFNADMIPIVDAKIPRGSVKEFLGNSPNFLRMYEDAKNKEEGKGFGDGAADLRDDVIQANAAEAVQHAGAVGQMEAKADFDDAVFPDEMFVAQLQQIELQMTIANRQRKREELQRLTASVIDLLNRVTPDEAEEDDLRNSMLVAGNCAVEMEHARMFREAEIVYKRAISLCPQQTGLHAQYCDFLIDRGRLEEAAQELRIMRELEPSHPRIPREEMKLALEKFQRGGSKEPDPEIEELLRRSFEANMSNRELASPYLFYLARVNTPLETFERVCREWEAALPPDEKWYALRALADRLSELRQYERALAIYESLLPQMQDRIRHDTLHNTATCCARLNLSEKAERYWREAYEYDRTDPNVRASFMQWLERQGKYDMAQRVAAGEPLD